MTFSKKRIELVFSLGKDSSGNQNTFAGQNGSNQVTLTGLRVSCKIVKNPGAQMNMCELRVFGLTPTVYNALTSIYQVTQTQLQNTVIVKAGDGDGELPVVFQGQITLAQIDLNNQPDCVLNVIAQTALLQAITPAQSNSFPDGFDLATAMGTLASQMGLNFEPNGVKQTLPAMTLNGPTRQQALKLAEAAMPTVTIAFDDNSLILIPQGGKRENQTIPEISAATGMIGYPSYSNIGIGLRTIYNPNIKWGTQVQVKTTLDVQKLNGLWTVFNIVHTLEAEIFNGRWETELQAMAQSIS